MGKGRGTVSLECTCDVKSQREMCMQALPSLCLPLCCLLGNPGAEQSQQGNGNTEEKLLCGNLSVPFWYLLSATDEPNVALRSSVWLRITVASANYSNPTYFQLWTKCRDWSRSKPAENAVKTQKKKHFIINENILHDLGENLAVFIQEVTTKINSFW